jgi:hypothetical protein
LLHGGMDETGNMYDDFYAMSLGSGKDVLGWYTTWWIPIMCSLLNFTIQNLNKLCCMKI